YSSDKARCGQDPWKHQRRSSELRGRRLPRLGWFLVGRKILDENCHVPDAAAKFFRKRIQRFFSYVDEFFAFHPSPLSRKRVRHGRLARAAHRTRNAC